MSSMTSISEPRLTTAAGRTAASARSSRASRAASARRRAAPRLPGALGFGSARSLFSATAQDKAAAGAVLLRALSLICLPQSLALRSGLPALRCFGHTKRLGLAETTRTSRNDSDLLRQIAGSPTSTARQGSGRAAVQRAAGGRGGDASGGTRTSRLGLPSRRGDVAGMRPAGRARLRVAARGEAAAPLVYSQ